MNKLIFSISNLTFGEKEITEEIFKDFEEKFQPIIE